MHCNALRLAVRHDQHYRLFAEHECRGAAEKMRGDHRAGGVDRLCAFDDGEGIVAGVSHGRNYVAGASWWG